MSTRLKRAAKAALQAPQRSLEQEFPDATSDEITILERCRPFTMTSYERLWGVVKAVQYVCDRNLPGDFVECGVWRGGSSMAAALAFKSRGQARTLWLYDTYEGMPEPRNEDRKIGGGEAKATYDEKRDGAFSDWCRASLEDVQANLAATGYRDVRYVQGMVEATLPETKPAAISILRLDTDFYASTKAELEILWPLLSPGGVLILDDYGSWGGAKQAVDEFFADKPAILLNRIDYTGRMAIKA
jgi:hypothetical protein